MLTGKTQINGDAFLFEHQLAPGGDVIGLAYAAADEGAYINSPASGRDEVIFQPFTQGEGESGPAPVFPDFAGFFQSMDASAFHKKDGWYEADVSKIDLSFLTVLLQLPAAGSDSAQLPFPADMTVNAFRFKIKNGELTEARIEFAASLSQTPMTVILILRFSDYGKTAIEEPDWVREYKDSRDGSDLTEE